MGTQEWCGTDRAMRGKEHLAFGITTSVALAAVAGNPESAYLPNIGLTVMFGAIGSLLPDGFDSHSSMLGKFVPFSGLIEKTIGHRTLFHDVIFWAVVAYYATCRFPLSLPIWFGVAGHLFLDAMNTSGISFGFPVLRKKRSSIRIHILPESARFDSGSPASVLVSWALCASIVFFFFPQFSQTVVNLKNFFGI